MRVLTPIEAIRAAFLLPVFLASGQMRALREWNRVVQGGIPKC